MYDFPNKWELEKILITDVTAADTSIFKIDSKWWMLTNIDTSNIGDHDSELHIFSAEELLSDKWTPHPLNPVLLILGEQEMEALLPIKVKYIAFSKTRMGLIWRGFWCS